MNKVCVIGGGASGMLAAIFASEQGADVTLYEKNEKLGKKIYITGKGRCNLANDCTSDTFFANVVGNPKFLYSSYEAFDSKASQAFFEELGLKMKVERGNRVFPLSDHASDVTKVLEQKLRKNNVKIKLNTEVVEILTQISQVDLEKNDTLATKDNNADLDINNNEVESTSDKVIVDKWSKKKKEKESLRRITGLKLSDGSIIACDRIILCTGGLSYPSTGSDGFGHREAKKLGLKLTETSPGLVPFNAAEDYCQAMQGLALKNVKATITNQKGKKLYEDFGEMLFTHFGVSGPLMLSASSYVTKAIKEGPLNLRINLKPAVSAEQLDNRLVKLFEDNKNKQIKNIIGNILPTAMESVFLKLVGLSPDTEANAVTKADRSRMIELLTSFPVTLQSLRGYNEAIITRGGISVKEVNPKTMESKKIQGLYIAGELLDLDALTGGFNLQIAWSTGHAAGLNISKNKE